MGINLSQQAQQQRQTKKQRKGGSLMIVLSLLIILIALGAYGGVYFLEQEVDTEITGLNRDIGETKEALQSDEANEVKDVAVRIEKIKEVFNNEPRADEIVTYIQEAVVPDVTFLEVTYTNAENESRGRGQFKVYVVGETENFEAIAQQVLRLNEGLIGREGQDYVDTVRVLNIEREDENSPIIFQLDVLLERNAFKQQEE
jgi:flagellar basal body-associated protein FliL